MAAGSASGNRACTGSLCAELDRNVSRSHIDDKHRDKKRRNPPIPLFQVSLMIVLNGRKSSHTGADCHSDPFGIFPCNPETGIIDSHCSSSNRKMDEAVHLFDFFCLEVVCRIETLYFPGNTHRQQRSIKLSDGPYARLSF